MSTDWSVELIKKGVPKETVVRFIEWHKKHKYIWQEFEQRCLIAIRNGRDRLSAKMIIELIRGDQFVFTKEEPYQINNNYPAYYARIFAIKYPKYEKLFEFRTIRGITTKKDEEKNGEPKQRGERQLEIREGDEQRVRRWLESPSGNRTGDVRKPFDHRQRAERAEGG